ncbi:MAG TPA: SMC family ATPase [Gemmatimonadales bacterium]|nr:SMC family ATPase [Gemmatimonadales bacterium]
MRLLRLRLLNFRQHADTEIELGEGLTGIVGPNGAGKSTLLEAIAYALYGVPAARGTRETIRRRGAPPRAPVRVELDFVLGAHEYRIIRSLSNAELYQDRGAAPVANSIQAVGERVARLLGMTREEFFNTYFTGQKDLAVMAAMSGPERAQFLSRVLGYERLRTAQDRLRESQRLLRARLSGLESGLPDLAALEAEERAAAERGAEARAGEAAAAEALAAAELRVREAQPAWEYQQRLREEVRSLMGDLRVAEHQVAAARDRFQDLDRQLTQALAAHAQLGDLEPKVAPLPGLREERARLAELGRVAARRQEAMARLAATRSELASLASRLAELPHPEAVAAAREALAVERQALEEAHRRATEHRTAWVRDQQDAATKRQALREQYAELRAQRDALREAGAAGSCPTCGRPLGGDLDGVLGLLERQLEDIQFNGNFYRQRIEQLESMPADLEQAERERAALEAAAEARSAEVGGLERGVRERPGLERQLAALRARLAQDEAALATEPIAYDADRHATVERLIADLEPAALQVERLRLLAERAATLGGECEAADRIASERAAEAEALRTRLAGLGFTDEAHEAARQGWEAAERGRREAEVGAVRARAARDAAERLAAEAARRREEREARTREIAAVRGDLLLEQELDRALADLRTDLNQALRPDLAELASGFLAELTGGRYSDFELDESYVPLVLEDGEPKPVISGGEEDVANLALRLAISQMIAERAGQPLSLLVLDEIFGSLDEERRQSVLDLLRALADRFPQVILITHIESVRDGFDRVLRVEFDRGAGMARVKEDPGGAQDVAA